MTVTSNQQPATSFYVYDAANRLTSIQLPDSSIQGYTWDNRGNLLADGTFTYTYSAAGRMVRAESITATLVYTYNADGLRVAQAQSVASVESVDLFTWDWATGVPELLSDGESLYLIGYDTLGWQTGTDWTFVLPDALGSVRQETDAAGAVTAAREWSPYGEEIGGAQTGLGFTGEWFDASVGLMYLRVRWYDSGMGRFTQLDLLRIEQNLYLYAGANPLNWADPSGLYRALVVQGANPVGLAVRSSPYYMPDKGPMFKTNLLRRIPDGTKVVVNPGYPIQSTDPGSPVKWWYKIFSIDGELVGNFFGPWAASEYLVDPTEQPEPLEPPTPPLPTPSRPPECDEPPLPAGGLVLPIKDPIYYSLFSDAHKAYDITSQSGNRTVYSMGYGTVEQTDVHNDSPTWYYFRVRMNAGYYINYVHIERTDLHIGDYVGPDTVIGIYGAVGNCDPPDFAHLHVQFESPIYQGIDPAPYWPGGAP